MAPSCQLQLACSIHSGFLGFPEISAHMFLRAQGRERLRYSLKCSFLEIYNETITDLLNPAAYNLQIREDIRRGCYVEGLSEEIVLNGEDGSANHPDPSSSTSALQTMHHEGT